MTHERSSNRLAWLSLGSNIRPEWYLPQAVELLNDLGKVIATSPVWESAAVGRTDQPPFCNAAVLLETLLDVASLCWRTREIEQALDRVRVPDDKNAPRTIDIDLSLYVDAQGEDAIGSIAHWTLPAADVLSRPFVAVPLAAISPDKRFPNDGRTLQEIATELSKSLTLRPRLDITLPGPSGPVAC
ncbi:MAG: 2-amino-4-hydroxy-6-hydroxymethyldihydropteridine diphosphokinase [Planctomycetaceae bacterium]